MSGLAAGKAPSTDAQWARDVQQSLTQSANPLTQRVGDWVFSQAADGSLQATKPGAAAVIIDGEGNLVSTQLAAGAVPVTATSPLTWQQIWNLFTGSATSTSTASSPAGDWITEIQTYLTNLWDSFLTPSSTPVTTIQTAINQLGAIWTEDVTDPVNEAVSQAQAGVNSFLSKLGLLQTSAANLVIDPGFSTASMWTGEAGSQSTVVAHSGIYCWQLQGQG